MVKIKFKKNNKTGISKIKQSERARERQRHKRAMEICLYV